MLYLALLALNNTLILLALQCLRVLQDRQGGCTWNKCRAADVNWLSGYYFHWYYLWIWPNTYTCFTQSGDKKTQNQPKHFSRECLSSSIPDLHWGTHTLRCVWAARAQLMVTCGSPVTSSHSCWAVALTGSRQDGAENNSLTWTCFHFSYSLFFWSWVKMKRSLWVYFGRFVMWTN